MSLTINIYIDGVNPLNDLLSKVDALTRLVKAEGKVFMLDLQKLQDAVNRTQDTEESAILLIKGLSQQIKDAAADPVKLQQLADQLNAKADAMAAAIVANTPADTTGGGGGVDTTGGGGGVDTTGGTGGTDTLPGGTDTTPGA